MGNYNVFTDSTGNSAHRNNWPDRNSIYTVIIWGAAVLISSVFLLIIGNLIWNGAGKISWEFLTGPPLNAGREGGISSILVSTALILGVATFVSLPIGLGTSIFLSEFTSV